MLPVYIRKFGENPESRKLAARLIGWTALRLLQHEFGVEEADKMMRAFIEDERP